MPARLAATVVTAARPVLVVPAVSAGLPVVQPAWPGRMRPVAMAVMVALRAPVVTGVTV